MDPEKTQPSENADAPEGGATGAADRGATRGPQRAAGRGYPAPLPRCAAMAIGSVPHEDPEKAVELVLRYTPEIPAWPQLPRRSFLENMYAQFGEGLPGLVVDAAEERLYVAPEGADEEFIAFVENLEAAEPEGAVPPDGAFAIGPEHAAALPLLLEALEGLEPPFVKGQVTGPVSFGLSVAFEDRRGLLFDDTYREAAGRLLAAKARWQERLLAKAAPASLPFIMFDEPYLTQLGSGFLSLPGDTLDILAGTIRAVGCLRGIHVCGGTDWARMAELPLDALDFDAADHFDAVAAAADAVGAFVGEGGLLVWGAVPNDERARRMTPEDVGRTVVGGVETLARRSGVDEEGVLRASFVAPACGTGTLPEGLAETCFRLTAEASEWLRARL